MKQLTTSSLKQGYITIPRALLNRQATDGAAGETEAFLQILAHQLFRRAIRHQRDNHSMQTR